MIGLKTNKLTHYDVSVVNILNRNKPKSLVFTIAVNDTKCFSDIYYENILTYSLIMWRYVTFKF